MTPTDSGISFKDLLLPMATQFLHTHANKTEKYIATATWLEGEMCGVKNTNKQRPCAKIITQIKTAGKVVGCWKREVAQRIAHFQGCMHTVLHVIKACKKKEAQWSMCSLREEEKGEVRQFLPAGSYLTSRAIVPDERTCKTSTHPQKAYCNSLTQFKY